MDVKPSLLAQSMHIGVHSKLWICLELPEYPNQGYHGGACFPNPDITAAPIVCWLKVLRKEVQKPTFSHDFVLKITTRRIVLSLQILI